MTEEAADAGANSNTEQFINLLAQFHAVEKVLLDDCRLPGHLDTTALKNYWDGDQFTYCPIPGGPCITLSSAVTVLNRFVYISYV